MRAALGGWTACTGVLAVLLMAPGLHVAAAQDSLSAATLEARGDVSLTGRLQGYIHESRIDTEPSTLKIELHAKQIFIEMDHRYNATNAIGAQVGGEEDTSRQEHRLAVLEQTATRASFELTVFPLLGQPPPKISAEHNNCLQAQPSNRDKAAPSAFVDADRRLPATLLNDTLAITSACRAAFIVQGSFAMSLWEWDVLIQEPEGRSIYQTGEFQRQGADDPTGTTTGAHQYEKHQAFLTVVDGFLLVEDVAPDTSTFYIRDVGLTHASSLLLRDALGQLGTTVMVEGGRDLVLQGAIQADLAAPGERIQVSNMAGVEVLQVGAGPQQPLAASITPSMPSPRLMTNAGIVVLAAMAAMGGLLYARRRHARGEPQPRRNRPGRSLQRWLWTKAERQYGTRHDRRALWWLWLHVRHHPNNAHAHAMRAVIYRNQRRLQSALASHERAHRCFANGYELDKAQNAYEASRICSLLRQGDQAAKWMKIAVRLDSSFLIRTSLEPDFGHLESDRIFQNRLQQLRALHGGEYSGI